MAKDKETGLAIVEPTVTDLAVVPSFISDYAGAGAEEIDDSRGRPNQLELCQPTSKQRKKSENSYIPGLEEPNMFNSKTREIYGDGPVKLVVIKALPERAVEYKPFNEGGGVVDRDVPTYKRNGKYVDERLNWHGDVGPVATLYRPYLVMLLNTEIPYELVTVSFHGTGLKASRDIDDLVKNPLKIGGKVIQKPPTFARVFELSTTTDKKDGNTFSIYVVRPAGTVDERTGALAAQAYDEYKTRVIDVDVVGEPEGDGIPF